MTNLSARLPIVLHSSNLRLRFQIKNFIAPQFFPTSVNRNDADPHKVHYMRITAAKCYLKQLSATFAWKQRFHRDWFTVVTISGKIIHSDSCSIDQNNEFWKH